MLTRPNLIRQIVLQSWPTSCWRSIVWAGVLAFNLEMARWAQASGQGDPTTAPLQPFVAVLQLLLNNVQLHELLVFLETCQRQANLTHHDGNTE